MLRNQENLMWDPNGIRNAGMDPNGVFTFSGVDAEPVNEWDPALNMFTHEVVGWSYPVVQDWTDPQTGEVFQQNQIEVAIDDVKKLPLKFGDKVRFSGLGGFYSRRSHRFKAHAESIQKVTKDENGKN